VVRPSQFMGCRNVPRFQSNTQKVTRGPGILPPGRRRREAFPRVGLTPAVIAQLDQAIRRPGIPIARSSQAMTLFWVSLIENALTSGSPEAFPSGDPFAHHSIAIAEPVVHVAQERRVGGDGPWRAGPSAVEISNRIGR